MGNRTSTGKVILSNGTVQEFYEPLTVAEVMLEHPHQVILEFDKSLANSKTFSKKPRPLPADTLLDTKNVYLMVPAGQRKKVSMDVTLSPKELRRLITRDTNSNLVKTLEICRTLFPKAILRYVSARGKMCSLSRKDCVEECLLKQTVCRTEIWEEMTERHSRKVLERGWRPSLDTIIEKNVENKVSHWLY